MEDEKTFLNKKITHEMVYREVIKQGKVQKEILEHARFTNGKIAKAIKEIDLIHEIMETKADKMYSIGEWIRNHPFRFAIGLMVVLSILISDIRHPLFEMLVKLFR